MKTKLKVYDICYRVVSVGNVVITATSEKDCAKQLGKISMGTLLDCCEEKTIDIDEILEVVK